MDKTWFQNYDPLNNAVLSTVLAALPILILLGSIAFFKIRIHFAALAGLGVAILVAVFVYQMPASAVAATTIYGGAYGLFPIGWIILNLIFLYQLIGLCGRCTIAKFFHYDFCNILNQLDFFPICQHLVKIRIRS